MAKGPTRNLDLEGREAWKASAGIAATIRLTAFVIPLAGAWLLIRLVGASLYRPGGDLGLVLWMGQAAVIGSSAVMAIDRVTRRMLPLAALYGMSLIFPDEAPSRFSMALRMGSTRRASKLPNAGMGSTAQEAAEQAIELVALLGAHDRRTRGHSERVRAYVDLIAEELELDEVARSRLSWAALLHDIGKIQVSPSILNKEGKPTPEEWRELAEHPMHSIHYLGPLESWLGEWGGAAAHHHERWDGTGYPFRLTGTEITLAGRITAVADAYDSMTAKRSYNVPLEAGVARKELVSSAGSQFDPTVVRAFLNVSLGRRWWAGPFTWITQVPSLGSAATGLTALSSVAISSMAVAGAVHAGVAPVPDLPSQPETAEVSRIVDDSGSDLRPLEEPTQTTITTTTVTTTRPPETTTTTPSATPPTIPATAPTTSTTPPTTTTTTPPTTTTAPGPPATTTTPPTTSTTTPPTTTTAPGPPTTITTPPTTTATPPTTTTAPGPPTATNDSFTAAAGADERIFVLANDDPGDSEFLISSLRVVSAPIQANSFSVHDDHLHYQSLMSYSGPDSLVYEICNTDGLCETATLSITVVP